MKLVVEDSHCVVCKSPIGAEIETFFEGEVPIGPGSAGYAKRIVVFHCSNPACALWYYHPPGKPNAAQEILTQHISPEAETVFSKAELEETREELERAGVIPQKESAD